MDSQDNSLEVGGVSMISDFSEPAEILEVTESTGLSPLTSSLDHNLTFHEDSPSSNESKMGIENTWTEANTSASDYAVPLQASFPELVSDPLNDNRNGVEHGPFLPSSEAELNDFFSDTGDPPDDSVIVNAPAGVCGLRNLGNTCFMAAGLQCLTATPPVLCHFLELQQRSEKVPPPGSLMANFSALLSKMWSGKYNVLQPTEFKETLGVYHSQFKDYRQHDCQEFLALLLDSLHEQMNLSKTNKPCHIPTATATTASATNSNQNGDKEPCLGATFNTATCDPDFMDFFDEHISLDNPNSPNVTMAGSPRESCLDDLDSTANSPHNSPLNEDEETLDSDEIVDPKSSFNHNDMKELRQLRLNKFNDIAKDAKTSNANFLVSPQECNNEIHYDSQKFPKENSRRITLENANLTESHDFDNKNVSGKRLKEVNCQRTKCSPECVSSGSETEYDSGLEKCNVKRMRLEDQEKNHKKDVLDADALQCARLLQNHENGAVATQDDVEAEKHWSKHLRANRSVIVDTFQGQFKSTVVCSHCKHVSVTYEPFMYLSVPLPYAMERQLTVTYIPANGESPIRCVVSLNKQSRVSKLKEELLKTLEKNDVSTSSIAVAEVLENHIAKILEDNLMLKFVNDSTRLIYAFELKDPPEPWVESDTAIPSTSSSSGCSSSNSTDQPIENSPSSTSLSVGSAPDEPCTICLEENDGDLKRHSENNCKLLMCDPCIENYFKSDKRPNKCPVCSAEMTSSSFVRIDQSQRARPAIRILNVPLVMRHDTVEATNNRKSTKLFGHPRLFKLPSRIDAKDLWTLAKTVVPEDDTFTLHLVDGQGRHCSRCIFGSHCTGCKVVESGMVNLQNIDTLAIRYTENVPTTQQVIDHVSVSQLRKHHQLSLYDCLQAFSQSEILDEHNPWYCPKCRNNQCATKTLTVHRYPKFLIVYLKRFVFYECVSTKLDDKVTFPLVGLSCGKHLYDLYACVCHFGGVSAGHYTAYAKNPQTDVWHYYNDDITSKQKPHEEDFSNAYILFYSRQGSNVKQCNI
ncbi:ubiquitin carboxyl-terminal hydrolase 4-like isoform X2 [Phymastichus coffea]|uniref:ubiquitin carboxyl-terminal hydrolase 4-like isoform X2 n=1 Tax=Phymastichus coffea TaxID=108790 RepID=UPI00273CCB42|nr:ubiquitin carboxyl-terminal hydrolase 4-like isoform X2 [Phymastichus coffea]